MIRGPRCRIFPKSLLEGGGGGVAAARRRHARSASTDRFHPRSFSPLGGGAGAKFFDTPRRAERARSARSATDFTSPRFPFPRVGSRGAAVAQSNGRDAAGGKIFELPPVEFYERKNAIADRIHCPPDEIQSERGSHACDHGSHSLHAAWNAYDRRSKRTVLQVRFTRCAIGFMRRRTA